MSNLYHKIHSPWKRRAEGPDKGRFTGEWSLPEFEYLRDNEWEFTEKVDGTNIRILLSGDGVRFGGRTERAQIPTHLLDALTSLFDNDRCSSLPEEAVLFGEGYGPKIQKGGSLYRDTPGFVLFDVRVGRWWLTRDKVEEVAGDLGIDVVPVVGRGTIHDMVRLCRDGLQSTWGEFEGEGVVARPTTPLLARSGARIITKLKCRDFR